MTFCLLMGVCMHQWKRFYSPTFINHLSNTQAEARDQLAEATAHAASLREEAERLQVQEEALALQRVSNEQALSLAGGEMQRLRAEAQGLREERVCEVI